MECSTKQGNEQALEQALQAIQHEPVLGQEWEQVQERMGIDLEQTARQTRAIQRLREVRSAADLLRLILFFAVSDWSLRLCGAWALVCGIGYLSDVAILKRLRNSHAWLSHLVGQLMRKRCAGLRSLPGVRLRILDATTLSAPGSKGIDWRIHLSFDLGQFCVDGLEVTDKHGGETLARFPVKGNEILIADAGYAFASGMGPVLWQGAGLIVRINWRNVALFTPEGQRFPMMAWLRSLSQPSETPVEFETPQGWVSLRLLAFPMPPDKAEEARRRVRKRYQTKQKPLSQETLFAAGFVLLVTNLPADRWNMALVFFLYRVRWQIELQIKRLKSLLHFDALRAKDPNLAQTYVLAKLLLALLIDDMTHQVALQQPEWFVSLDHPFNPSRITIWLYESMRQMIFGPWLLKNLAQWIVIMRRYFCDPPRSRIQQLALARAVFEHINSSSPVSLS
jgi:hypothetical protein